MPKYAIPANGESAEDPIEAFGNRLRAGMIGYLRQHPDQTKAEIAKALDVPAPTVTNALQKLLAAGLLSADPPQEEWSRGQRVRYRVRNDVVSELYLQFGQAIGEI
ncbi:ArsR family transcriptional regulator [Microbacterium pumilum]|uniref:HTH arsR-type domain-containing protein n=1 Tax=Microbacterium pumilum TaxID=344165 RepID=A0ABP5DFF8_9MICO